MDEMEKLDIIVIGLNYEQINNNQILWPAESLNMATSSHLSLF